MGETGQEGSESEPGYPGYIFNYCEECEVVSIFCFKSNSTFQHISVQSAPLSPLWLQYVNEGNTILCLICSQCFNSKYSRHKSAQWIENIYWILLGFSYFDWTLFLTGFRVTPTIIGATPDTSKLNDRP